MPERYSNMNLASAFGLLTNALEGGGDRNRSFPQSDAEDLSRGARFIPGEVTVARRRGERIIFVDHCSPCCWYWEFPGGQRIYHWDRYTYEQIAEANGVELEIGEFGTKSGDPGPCPHCGNSHTRGGTINT